MLFWIKIVRIASENAKNTLKTHVQGKFNYFYIGMCEAFNSHPHSHLGIHENNTPFWPK